MRRERIIFFRFCVLFLAFSLAVSSSVAGDLPVTEDCAFLKGKVLESVIITDEGPNPEFATNDPAYDVRLLYPREYLRSPYPFGAPSEGRQDGLNLSLKLPGGEPFRVEDRFDSKNRPLRPQDYAPNVSILLHDRYPLSRVIAITANIWRGDKFSYEDNPINTVESEIANLKEIYFDRKNNIYNGERLFVRWGDEGYSDMIKCYNVGRVINPGCNHYFDYKNIDVDMYYGLNELKKYSSIRKMAENFIHCIYDGEIRVETPDGDTKWH